MWRPLGKRQLRVLFKLGDGHIHPTSHFTIECHGWEFAQVTLKSLEERGLINDGREFRRIAERGPHKWMITERGKQVIARETMKARGLSVR